MICVEATIWSWLECLKFCGRRHHHYFGWYIDDDILLQANDDFHCKYFFATTDDIWPSNDDDILDFKQTMLNGVKYWKTMFYYKMVDSQQADEGPQN